MSLQGGSTLPKKIMPGVGYCTNPGRAYDWSHGVPVRAIVLPEIKEDFFLRPVQPPDQTFTHPPNGRTVFAVLPEFTPAEHVSLSIPMAPSARHR